MKHLFLFFAIFYSCQTREVKFNAPVPGKLTDTITPQPPETIGKDQAKQTTTATPAQNNITESVESIKKESTAEIVTQKNTAEPDYKKMIDSGTRNNPKGGATDGDGFIPFIKQY